MMGRSHVILGGVLWLGLGELLGQGTHSQLAVGALVSAGAALLPDLDHPEATIAHTLGPITHVLARGVHALAGGHRQATHSLVFVALVTGAALLLGLAPWGGGVVVFVCAALALRTVGPMRAGVAGAVVAAVVTVVVTRTVPLGGWWLAEAVGLGCLCHILADALTPEGVPLAWPARARLALPVVSHTGNVTEGVIASGGLVGLLWLAWITFGPVH
jgi:membrane-bound metal-dependent hydrolase YbcI (DUF457 family)